MWETKQMKELAQDAAMRGDARVANQVAVIGSIGLYLNALNIFIILLNLLGFVFGRLGSVDILQFGASGL